MIIRRRGYIQFDSTALMFYRRYTGVVLIGVWLVLFAVGVTMLYLATHPPVVCSKS